MIQTRLERKYLFTPLRYPGGKTSLFRYFDQLLTALGSSDTTYVEPFAGGAGAALSLLLTERVRRILINDLDPAIAALWRSVVHDSDSLVALIRSAPLTIDEWHKQRAVYEQGSEDPLELGFATLYLNRTNRSGILRSGPIGGYNQSGKWKIDARFNRDTLADKVSLIARYKSRIILRQQDGLSIISEMAEDQRSFMYVDPPYFVQGSELYLNAYGPEDHAALAATLESNRGARWVLTYDNVPEIQKLYASFISEEFNLSYSAHTRRVGTELMVFSDSVADFRTLTAETA